MWRRSFLAAFLLWFLSSRWAPAAEATSATCSGIVRMKGRAEAISIADFGGVGDGKTLNTWAFRKAIYRIQHLRKRGGTLLYVPPGVWLTGSFNLTSHMTLFLAKGAVIRASQVDYISLPTCSAINIFQAPPPDSDVIVSVPP